MSNNLYENIDIFLNSLYFSVVTFTTLGYGDITPIGISKLFASIEALLGGFILALFVVVFVKKDDKIKALDYLSKTFTFDSITNAPKGINDNTKSWNIKPVSHFSLFFTSKSEIINNINRTP